MEQGNTTANIYESPISKTLDVWPLAGAYSLRWGCDETGEMWVAVEDGDGECKSAITYREYLGMEAERT
jgi:hypothetical protein